LRKKAKQQQQNKQKLAKTKLKNLRKTKSFKKNAKEKKSHLLYYFLGKKSILFYLAFLLKPYFFDIPLT